MITDRYKDHGWAGLKLVDYRSSARVSSHRPFIYCVLFFETTDPAWNFLLCCWPQWQSRRNSLLHVEQCKRESRRFSLLSPTVELRKSPNVRAALVATHLRGLVGHYSRNPFESCGGTLVEKGWTQTNAYYSQDFTIINQCTLFLIAVFREVWYDLSWPSATVKYLAVVFLDE